MTDNERPVRKRRVYNAGYSPEEMALKPTTKTLDKKESEDSRKKIKIPRIDRTRPIRQKPKALESEPTKLRKDQEAVPPLAKGDIRIIPLGGVEEIGRNMTCVEYMDEIVVVDAGFQFESKDTPGVDYILANTGYLRDNKHKIKAVCVTHGHLDHIGGMPYLMNEIGNVPIYSTELVNLLIKARQEDFPHSEELDLRSVKGTERIKIGKHLAIEFFNTTHTFPDSIGIIIKTDIGDIAFTGDIKLDHKDGVPTKKEEENFAKFKNNPPLCLLMDSTNVWKPGWSIPESKVFETFEEIIGKHKSGRMIVGAFGSQIERLANLIATAEKHGMKVSFEGRTLRQNMTIAEKTGFFKAKKGTIIDSEQIPEYPPNKVLVLATGAQGDEYAALMRIAKKQHKTITLTPQDTVVFSASVIPGNEIAVQKLKDLISRQGSHIITVDTSDVHASGHGYMEEAKWIHRKIRPKFFIPQHGYYHMLRTHVDVMHEATGLPYENMQIPDGNSAVIEIRENGTKMVQLKEKVASALRVVEGHKITDIQTTVMRDRKELSAEGIFVVVVTIDKLTGRLRKSPDIISRGFVYLRESQELIQETRLVIKKTVFSTIKRVGKIDSDQIKADLSVKVLKYLMQQTHKRPIVIPVVIIV